MPESTRRVQTLALSGGGYRGLFTAQFLGLCEEKLGAKQCGDKFELISGTSIGALLAAGLAAKVPAMKLVEIMEEYGPKIFQRNIFTGAKRLMFTAAYNAAPIRVAIRKALGEEVAKLSLSEFDAPLVITAVNYSTGQVAVFRSRGVADNDSSEIRIEDAILASAAAPSFFPTQKIGASEYIDGGLVANAPDMVAICDAINYKNVHLSEIFQLSIGTPFRREGTAVHDTPRAPGALSWILLRGLVQSIMAAQEDLALSQAGALLGKKQFLRIDKEPASHQVESVKSLDQVSKRATCELKSLAKDAWETYKRCPKLRNFFDH